MPGAKDQTSTYMENSDYSIVHPYCSSGLPGVHYCTDDSKRTFTAVQLGLLIPLLWYGNSLKYVDIDKHAARLRPRAHHISTARPAPP